VSDNTYRRIGVSSATKWKNAASTERLLFTGLRTSHRRLKYDSNLFRPAPRVRSPRLRILRFFSLGARLGLASMKL